MEKKTISTHEFSEYEDRYQVFGLISLILLQSHMFIQRLTEKKTMKSFFIYFVFPILFSQDKGLESFKNQKYQESYSYYLNILKNRKMIFLPNMVQEFLHLKMMTTETGMQYLKEVLISDNDLIASKAHFNLGNIYKDENKLEESIYHYKKAIELNSLDKDAKINFELVKNMLNQDKESNDGENTQKDKDNEE